MPVRARRGTQYGVLQPARDAEVAGAPDTQVVLEEPEARLVILGLRRIDACRLIGLSDRSTTIGQHQIGACVVGWNERLDVVQIGQACPGRGTGMRFFLQQYAERQGHSDQEKLTH